MKKIMWLLVSGAIASFIAWSKNPLDDTLNFIIGGTIPGTKNSVGFWPMLGVAALFLFVIFKVNQNLKLQRLEHTAQQIKKEQAETEFQESAGITFDTTKRSVIAAPSHKSAV